MNDISDVKVNRILTIYLKLSSRELVKKKELAKLFSVSEKTIQRDLEDIRFYFYNNSDTHGDQEIIYNYSKKGYHLKGTLEQITKEDILAISKILLESRAFCNEELNHLLNVILKQADSEQRKCIKHIIGNEMINYVPLKHNSMLLSRLWELSEMIRNNEIVNIIYKRADDKVIEKNIKPVGIIFSEYYFYLICYINNLDSPTIFRVDRISTYKVIGERFYIPYSERFEDGEFRKRVQFMYTGKLINIRFEFYDNNIESVLDRLPTATIVKKFDNKYTVEAEVYGKGIVMWILSQGSKIKVLEPQEIITELSDEIGKLSNMYIRTISKED